MAAPAKIALFGGTFDPIHDGHLEVASKAAKSLDLDSVIFIPCRQSPHKDKAPGANDADRLAMLRLATSSRPWASVDDFELLKPPPSYTWETVAHFMSHTPSGTRLFLLIGFDQWESLPRWSKIETLRQQVTFIVVGRQSQPRPRPGFQAHFIEGNHPASSQKIRQNLSRKKPPKWLPDSVIDYINKKGLYSTAP